MQFLYETFLQQERNIRQFGGTGDESGGIYTGDNPALMSQLRRTVKQLISEQDSIPPTNSSGSRTREVFDYTSECNFFGNKESYYKLL